MVYVACCMQETVTVRTRKRGKDTFEKSSSKLETTGHRREAGLSKGTAQVLEGQNTRTVISTANQGCHQGEHTRKIKGTRGTCRKPALGV